MSRSLLGPLEPLYRLALALRELRLRWGIEKVERLRFPVVSIGNLSTGGSGKTPLTIALVRALAERGLAVDVLSRGYGRRSRQAVRVDPAGAAESFGDEPLLIARATEAPVFVARRRYEAGLLAESAQAQSSQKTIHILDDGYQHRQLARHVNIVLLDTCDWRDRLLPAGNLREPLTALRRADVVAIPAGEPELEPELRDWGWGGAVWKLRRSMSVPTVDGPVMAFCGIARPGQFFAGLESAGLALCARRIFKDHEEYRAEELRRMLAEGERSGARAFVTTAKDAARLGDLAQLFPASRPLLLAGLQTEIVDEATALAWLLARFGAE